MMLEGLIRLAVPAIDEADLEATAQVLKSGHLVQGKVVSQFEQVISDYVGAKNAIAVSSGTAALHLALLGLGIKRGDRIAVSANSWPATANVIELCGAIPVFVDIDIGTFNMTLDLLRDAIATEREIRAILIVHAFGLMADMTPIVAFAEEMGIPVIEDAACALGARRDGVAAGTAGLSGCFSFHPRKNVTTGEGGVIVTDDSEIARTARILRNHGQDLAAGFPDFVVPGFNYRLTEIQAALGVCQMQKIDKLIAARRDAAAYYAKSLAGTSVGAPAECPEEGHVFQSYVVRLPEGVNRDAVIRELKVRNIECGISTYHMPSLRYYREKYGYRPGSFPNGEAAYERGLSLPLFAGITRDDQDRVVSALLAAVR